MNHRPSQVLIGQLLVKSGILEAKVLEIALESARDSGRRIGQVLLYSGLVSAANLRAALTTQRMLRRSLITFDQAIRTLMLVREEELPYEFALKKAYFQERAYSKAAPLLARLILDAGLAEQEDMTKALALSIKHKYALGRVLMLHDILKVDKRKAAIEAVILIRRSAITYDQALACLQSCTSRGESISGILSSEVTLVEEINKELSETGLLTYFEILDIIEHSLENEALWNSANLPHTIVSDLKSAAEVSKAPTLTNDEISIESALALSRKLLTRNNKTVRKLKNTSPLAMLATG